MTIRRVVEILEAKIATGEDQLDLEVSAACGRLYEAGLRSGGIRDIV
jgi:hypothetical protein